MDGASKFVRGDAVAGIIILAVNIFGGIIIGATRHGMPMSEAADVYTKLSVGDGLVSQIPALIVSLAAALLVSKGGTRGSADKAVLSQLAHYPRALWVAALLMGLLALVPGLPIFPFAVLGSVLAFTAWAVPRRRAEELKAGQAIEAEEARKVQAESANSIKESLKTVEIELVLGRQLGGRLLANQGELGLRVAKLRRKFAMQYGRGRARHQGVGQPGAAVEELPDQDPRHGRRAAGGPPRRSPRRDRRGPGTERARRILARAVLRHEGGVDRRKLRGGTSSATASSASTPCR